jgi:2-polyprenyl-3-methyl-5-hydroxy-6-metoxy-1,4-benzoquinol methylase
LSLPHPTLEQEDALQLSSDAHGAEAIYQPSARASAIEHSGLRRLASELLLPLLAWVGVRPYARSNVLGSPRPRRNTRFDTRFEETSADGSPDKCKICGSKSLVKRRHAARCKACGVYLYYPYPDERELSGSWAHMSAEQSVVWYARSARFNHDNFTRMLRFATDGLDPARRVRFLDYGCGGGQFALVAKSHFPNCEVFSTDAGDDALLPQWLPLQQHLRFSDFHTSQETFDFIFLNDVFEHVRQPTEVLRLLASKLAPDGKIFIDTPKSFWLYPITRVFSPALHDKLLVGTVSLAHLQIWSKKSFLTVVANAGLAVEKYQELSEYTMPAAYYLDNMGVRNPAFRLAGSIFHSQSKLLARNKIMGLLSKLSA